MSNINERIYVLPTLQASGADVSSTGGVLKITGVDPIQVNKIQSGGLIASLHGLPVAYTITSTAAIAASTSYQGSIRQVVDGKMYVGSFEYVTPSVAPGAAAFYASIEAKIQELITGNQVLGSVTSGAGGTVFTGTVDAPVAEIALVALSSAAAATTLTAAGSSATNATPRVLTAGAAHGLTVGQIYSVTISGVTDPGAADMNRTLLAIPASATTLTLLGTSNTGAVVTTSAVMTVNNTGDETFASAATGITGFSSSTPYVGVDISALSVDSVDSGLVIPRMVLAPTTDVANANAFINALRTALSSTPAAIG